MEWKRSPDRSWLHAGAAERSCGLLCARAIVPRNDPNTELPMNQGILAVLALAFLPAAGNFAGGVASEFLRPSSKTLNRALHLAAGIVLAVVAVEVMPEALGAAASWILALAFVAGGGLYILVEAAVTRWQRTQEESAGAGAWMVYVAVAADLVGTGSSLAPGPPCRASWDSSSRSARSWPTSPRGSP